MAVADPKTSTRGFDPRGTALLRFSARRPSSAAGSGAAAGPRTATGSGARPSLAMLLAAIEPRMKIHDLAPEIADVASELAVWQSDLQPADSEALLFLILSALVSVKRGSTRLAIHGTDDHRAALFEILASLAGPTADVPRLLDTIDRLLDSDALSAVAGRPGEYKPLIIDRGHLYLERILRQEDRLVEALARRITGESHGAPTLDGGAVLLSSSPAEITSALERVVARPSLASFGPLLLSAEQREAVECALRSRLTVISGGPGTGKTSIVIAILRVFAELGVPAESIALAAPTGRAAKRIAESVQRGLASISDPSPSDRSLLERCPVPRTLHRLLGYGPSLDRFHHHENNPLAERVVIVDESSMIDLALMDRLVRSVRDDARLILLGDAEQLHSIDAGAVFRDISEKEDAALRGAGFSVALRQSFRMSPEHPEGANLLGVAAKVRLGASSALFTRTAEQPQAIGLRQYPRDLTFSKTEMLLAGATEAQAAATRSGFIDRWYLERIWSGAEDERRLARVYALGAGGFSGDESTDIRSLLIQFEQARILCVTRSADFPTGASAINAVIHRKFVRDARLSASAAPADEHRAFLPGEPVIVEQNDYERGIFNGDRGVVLAVSEQGSAPRLMAVFPSESGFSAFPVDALGELISLSYAMTVHKAQGSEFDSVALILPDVDLPLLSRELIYTAITRSRRSVAIVGKREILERAVERRARRDSGLREKLAQSVLPRA